MELIYTEELNTDQRTAILHLWNNEYPDQLKYNNMSDLDAYIATLPGAKHFLYLGDQHEILGWAFKFNRDTEIWFAIILDSSIHKKGIGTMLLDKLKTDERTLSGWVVDHKRYQKINGEPYPSPLNFYLKNNFWVDRLHRLESPQLSAAKIRWKS